MQCQNSCVTTVYIHKFSTLISNSEVIRPLLFRSLFLFRHFQASYSQATKTELDKHYIKKLTNYLKTAKYPYFNGNANQYGSTDCPMSINDVE